MKTSKPTDEEMFQWLLENAYVDWSLFGDKVEITFNLVSEGFDDIKDAITQAMEADKNVHARLPSAP